MNIDNTQKKLFALKNILLEMEHVVLAYSGGVDSAFLLKIANDVLGNNVIAITGDSPTVKRSELHNAISIAKEIGAVHRTINTEEMCNPLFLSNPHNRCYYCKSELFSKLQQYAVECGCRYVIDGSNYDDTGDFRPGIEAARVMGVRSPLIEAELTKNEIRLLAKNHGLGNWNKKAEPCLSSRFPYGIEITETNLKMIEEAEEFLTGMGFMEFRVRYHGDIARIEVQPEALQRIIEPEIAGSITVRLKELGFSYVVVDLAGFKSGGLNGIL